MKINKRVFVKIISFLSAFALVLGGFALKTNCAKNDLKFRIEQGYKQSLSEFSSLLQEINFDLKKQLYSSSSEMLSALSSDIYKNTAAAKACLERLPITQTNSENIYKFLATAGDFSKAVAVSNGEQVDKNKMQLKKLIEFSDVLATEISNTAMQFEDGELLNEDVNNIINKLENKTEFSASTEDIAEIASGVPTLIYDGPFSDHVLNTKSKLLENAKEISKQQALEIAKKICKKQELAFCCDEESNTESYIFEDEDSVCAITKRGGYCLYMNETDDIEEPQTVSKEKSISIAKNTLKKVYGLDFKESYYIVSENVITINFAYVQDDVVFYSDLVKVGVDLSDGDVVSIEARGFVMNHHKRQNYTYIHTEKQASEKVSKELAIKSVNRAVVTDDALNEHYCYEFHTISQDGGDVIVYINDKDLSEQNIFIILHTQGGELAI